MANGWTPERRAKQAEAIKRWKPWERSTGPKTDVGKNRSSRNAVMRDGKTGIAKKSPVTKTGLA
jgi:hypothetical protein